MSSSSKHGLSPAPLPPAKRLHLESHLAHQHNQEQRSGFETALSDELVIHIFSYLSWLELCTMQATSKNFYRLGADNELWRSMFLQSFGRSRLRGGKGFTTTTRSDGKQVKPLPGRASNYTDWKWMFRISSNWRKGRCSVEYLDDALPDPAENHILVTGSSTITAGRSLARNPAFRLRSPFQTHDITTASAFGIDCWITQLALDQSPPAAGNIRVAVFLSTGEFSVFTIHPSSSASCSKSYTFVPARRSNRFAPIVAAAYHHPLIVTLSETFSLSLYDLSSVSQVRLAQVLTSFSSYPPTSLVLSTPAPNLYKLVLAHSAPVYPSHWSVAATEFLIAGQERAPPTASSLLLPSQDFVPFHVTSTRRTRAVDIPQGWIDETKLRLIQEQTSRKVLQVADTQTDGKWLVMAPALQPAQQGSHSHSPFSSSRSHSHTNLQLYRLSLPSVSSIASPVPKLTFVRSLTGQIGPISALALADGRCVSLGMNGSIWVWDLEGGTGAEVSTARLGETLVAASRGTIVFDERRIITSEGGKTVIRRFDI